MFSLLRRNVLLDTVEAMAPRDTADGSPAQIPVLIVRPAGTAAGERRPGILLMQEIFGINAHIREVAQRLAAQGFVVAAPDVLYRTGEPWRTFGYDQVGQAVVPFRTLTEELVVGDMAAALDFLGAQPYVDPDRLGAIGFCFGGRASLTAAIRFPGRVKASVVFYGGGIVADSESAPVNRVAAIKCPVLAFFGALDKHILPAHVERLEQALIEAGVENQVYLYTGADHGFFCDHRGGYNPGAAMDAWHRTVRFFHGQLAPVPGVVWQ